jgi:hypothetical protein
MPSSGLCARGHRRTDVAAALARAPQVVGGIVGLGVELADGLERGELLRQREGRRVATGGAIIFTLPLFV